MSANRLYTSQLKGLTTTTDTKWLVEGKPGNLQTMRVMRAMVRRDLGMDGAYQDQELRKFAARTVRAYGGGGFTWQARVRAVWFYVTKQFDYIPDPAGGNENIADARETIRDGWGDCDDLSVLLATLLGMVGVSTSFRAGRYHKDIDGYEHVYVIAHVPTGDLILDAARAGARPGREARYVEAVTLPIIDVAEQLRGLLDFASAGAGIGGSIAQGGIKSGIATGAAIGLNFVPVVGPILSSLVGPVMTLFGKTARNKPFSDSRDEAKDQIMTQQSAIQSAVDNCQITPDEGVRASQEMIQAYYSFCDKNLPTAIAKSCRNFWNEDNPGQAQQGAFKTHEQRIRDAGKNCTARSVTASGAQDTRVTGAAAQLSTPVNMVNTAASGGSLLLPALIIGVPVALLALRGR